MAGNQPPEPVVLNQRDRHAGAHTHVAEHSDAPAKSGAAPNGSSRPVARRHVRFADQWHRFRPSHIGNQADQVARIEFARLRRNVRGREAVAQIRFKAVASAFGDDLAIPVGVELVHHDPVETTQQPHLLHHPVNVDLHVGERIEPPQGIADRDEQVMEQVVLAGRQGVEFHQPEVAIARHPAIESG